MQLIVGLLTVDIYIPAAGSLKEKRAVIKSVKDKIGNKFNISIAEIDFQDKWQRARFGIAQVGNNYQFVENSLMTIFNIIDSYGTFQIIDHHFEFI